MATAETELPDQHVFVDDDGTMWGEDELGRYRTRGGHPQRGENDWGQGGMILPRLDANFKSLDALQAVSLETERVWGTGPSPSVPLVGSFSFLLLPHLS